MMTDPGYFATFLTAIKRHGELEAITIMEHETRQWLLRHQESTCQ